jgi:hypothetical protein
MLTFAGRRDAISIGMAPTIRLEERSMNYSAAPPKSVGSASLSRLSLASSTYSAGNPPVGSAPGK